MICLCGHPRSDHPDDRNCTVGDCPCPMWWPNNCPACRGTGVVHDYQGGQYRDNRCLLCGKDDNAVS